MNRLDELKQWRDAMLNVGATQHYGLLDWCVQQIEQPVQDKPTSEEEQIDLICDMEDNFSLHSLAAIARTMTRKAFALQAEINRLTVHDLTPSESITAGAIRMGEEMK